jgi:hypothetical protein
MVWMITGAAAALAIAAGVWFFVRPSGRPAAHGAVVVALRGDVSIVRDGNAAAMQAVMSVQFGQSVRTGADGSVKLQLPDGTSLQIGADTDVRLDAGRVELRLGQLSCDVTPEAREKPLVFASPHAEVTVLGTAFELSAALAATSVRVTRGKVRVTAGGRSIELGQGHRATADAQGLHGWTPVCDLNFRAMSALPAQLETVYCDSASLHSTSRHVVPAPNSIRLEDGGLKFVEAPGLRLGHGLAVARWSEEIGSDAAIEVEVSAGNRWSLGVAVDGDTFQGYRVVFAVPEYPNGITIDSLYPERQVLLAQDPRPIPFERDHVLQVEKTGRRIRVWVDREVRIDTEVSHPLATGRKKTFAISNFGEPPVIRALRVWKPTPAP